MRLIGDDQQLAAVGAGGVLRDITETHGAVQLTEVMRFADPAEAAASLALREGRLEALGFYLDQGRIHAGSEETVLRDALAGWLHDRGAGLDSVMLAGTRDQVAQLNRWARDHRLTDTPDAADGGGPVAVLSDGNVASVGDVIVTRMNDRRLSRQRDGLGEERRPVDRHRRRPDRRTPSSPPQHRAAGRAAADVCVGACGVGVRGDGALRSGGHGRHHPHGADRDGEQAAVVCGDEPRPPTRTRRMCRSSTGERRTAPIHPATLRPVTAGDVLEQVLARDGSSRSVTTEARHATDPYTRLGLAAARYTDAVTVAIEQLHADAATELDEQADQVVEQLTSCPAWPTLRSHLLHAAADQRRYAAGGVCGRRSMPVSWRPLRIRRRC